MQADRETDGTQAQGTEGATAQAQACGQAGDRALVGAGAARVDELLRGTEQHGVHQAVHATPEVAVAEEPPSAVAEGPLHLGADGRAMRTVLAEGADTPPMA